MRMNEPFMGKPEDANGFYRPNLMRFIWPALFAAWFIALCFVPDPRPLGASEFIVQGLRSIVGLSEPLARALATIVLRSLALAGLGILLVQSIGRVRLRIAIPAALILAPLFAILAQWINYGFFPISQQIRLGAVSAIAGVLLGFILRRNFKVVAGLVLLACGLVVWGASTGISDDLYDAARATGLHVLARADGIPEGDAGFARLMEVAFAFAEDNSHGRDPVILQQAAILALAVILGE